MDCQRVWYPTIFPDKCDGCIKFNEARCVKFCPHGVFDLRDCKAVVVNPLNCIYGCTACENICPRKAIIFPQRASIGQSSKKDKCLLKRVRCNICNKVFWTNEDVNLCLDCRKATKIFTS
ncbi:MAG: hypothetical protein QXF23_05770 [Candidatus Bathyarchaeia archaeon]